MRSIRKSGEKAPNDHKGLKPHQKIIRAAEKGKGLRLTVDEVWQLAQDEAIEQAAAMMDYPDCEDLESDPYRKMNQNSF